MLDFFKNKKAISPILALLIVLGVTIVVGAVFYAWGGGLFESSQEKTQAAVKGASATMSSDVLPYYVKVGIVGHDESLATFEYVSTDVDADNDKAIKKAASYKPGTYTGCTKDERVIFEVPIYIRNNAQDKTLKGVTAKVLGLSGHLWYALHLKYDETNDQYILCKKDDTEFVGYIGATAVKEDSTGLKYVFAPGSPLCINMSNPGYKFNESSGALEPQTASVYYEDKYYNTYWTEVEYQQYKNYTTNSFADNVTTPLRLISADGVTYFMKALTSSGYSRAVNTPNVFFGNMNSTFYGGSSYSDCKTTFNNPTYTIGDVPPNTVKTVNAYIMFHWIDSEYLPDIDEIRIKIQDSEGTLAKTIPLKFHIEDPEWS
ncbi:archaellin/type IV pilin N-terminal domain-containing protein [Methanocaldococcus fervens]|uniref:Uncharacterized protein n=1 Tax=Methanocaldococcus fervens (strain DSM 4213 / JCM 15782 / AG86) TaxID=573064 RepID=C7P5U3_METFA|nr:archaellin/type IV pilin N-terminal domain-containing protein [Methanocaldococcus fervens]ACV23925.1 hypothetical protein Mefer_0083 [Methanocaldococcus fervens AG86]